MKTFVIYNKDTGEVIMTQSGNDATPVVIDCLTAEIPNGKLVESVDLKTGDVVLTDIPKTEEQIRLDALEAQIAALAGSEG